MEKQLKRISLLITEDQHERLNGLGLNVSGLIRDLIDDHLSDHKVTVSVSEDTKKLYQTIVSNTGSDDSEIEGYFRSALQSLLREKIKEMEKLEKNAFGRK